VWCKLSGMVTEADWSSWTPADIAPYIGEVLRVFGPSRCLMGSDWPVSLLAADYQRTIGLVRDAVAGLPEADQRAVLWDSAVQVYLLDAGRL
jgi:L-fuconolactonase